MYLKFAFGALFLFVCLKSLECVVSDREHDKERALDDAERAKKNYQEILEGAGLQRLRHSISDEGKFGQILAWIGGRQIGLRRGTDLNGACYALSDFGEGYDEQWMHWPYTRDLGRTEHWYEKLYNSVANILLLEREGDVPLLLAAGGHPSGETYKVGSNIGIGGDEETFKKSVSVQGGTMVGEILRINDIESLRGMEGTVHRVLKWIETTFEQNQ